MPAAAQTKQDEDALRDLPRRFSVGFAKRDASDAASNRWSSGGAAEKADLARPVVDAGKRLQQQLISAHRHSSRSRRSCRPVGQHECAKTYVCCMGFFGLSPPFTVGSAPSVSSAALAASGIRATRRASEAQGIRAVPPRWG